MAIQRGDVQTSSNGSYMPQLDPGVTTAAWILECPVLVNNTREWFRSLEEHEISTSKWR